MFIISLLYLERDWTTDKEIIATKIKEFSSKGSKQTWKRLYIFIDNIRLTVPSLSHFGYIDKSHSHLNVKGERTYILRF